MAILCTDIGTLTDTYLDGELDSREGGDFDAHLVECATCRASVAAERAERSAIRARLAGPAAPALFHARMRAALAKEEAAAQAASRRAKRSLILPAAATFAAAAALFVFVRFGTGAADSPRTGVANEAVRQHMRRAPVEVQGAAVSPWIKEHFMPQVEPPRFSTSGSELVGARLGHLLDRETAQLFYDVIHDGARYELQVHILDASNLDLRSPNRHVVNGREIWVDDRLGYAVVSYKDRDGLGYVFTAAGMDQAMLIDLVVNSNLLLRVNEGLRGR